MDLYTPPSVAYGGAYAIRPYDWIRAALQKTVPFSSLSGTLVGRIKYAPQTEYVRFFKILMLHPQLGTCGPSKNCLVFVPFGAVEWAYAIRPYGWVRVMLRNTDAILQLGTCEGSKNGSVFATVGGVWWAYAIRSYDRVCAILRNTDAILQLGTCDSSKYRCDPPTGYVRPFKKLSRFRPLRGRLWGVCDTPLQLDTCDPSKYRCDLSSGGEGAFGMWGGGGYRLRGRRA